MSTTTQASAYETSESLFTRYPLAADHATMTLLVPEEGRARFFVLAHRPGADSGPRFTLYPWQNGEAVQIPRGGGVPAWVGGALAGAIPVPRDGSMFGYAVGEEITAVIPVYGYSEDHPEPSISPMPRAGVPRDLWPTFIGEPAIGRWFWDMVRDGRLVNLGPVVAGTSGAAFWVPLESPVSAGCIAVTRDVTAPSGVVLGAGLYVYHTDLDAGVPLPDGLEGATDLGPRFKA